MEFDVPADHRIKLKEREKKNKYLDFAWELKKLEHVTFSPIIINCNWWTWYSHQRTAIGTGRLGNKMTSGDHPNHSIIEID